VRKMLYQQEDDGQLFIGWVIEYEQKLWLVPQWLPPIVEGVSTPARIISLSDFALDSRP